MKIPAYHNRLHLDPIPADQLPPEPLAGPIRPGRPTTCTSERLDAICAIIRASGVSDTCAATKVGVPRSTISRWKTEDEMIECELMKARTEYLLPRLEQIAQTRRKDGELDWRAQAWLIQFAHPEDYGPPSRRRKLKDVKLPPTVEELTENAREAMQKLIRCGLESWMHDEKAWEPLVDIMAAILEKRYVRPVPLGPLEAAVEAGVEYWSTHQPGGVVALEMQMAIQLRRAYDLRWMKAEYLAEEAAKEAAKAAEEERLRKELEDFEKLPWQQKVPPGHRGPCPVGYRQSDPESEDEANEPVMEQEAEVDWRVELEKRDNSSRNYPEDAFVEDEGSAQDEQEQWQEQEQAGEPEGERECELEKRDNSSRNSPAPGATHRPPQRESRRRRRALERKLAKAAERARRRAPVA